MRQKASAFSLVEMVVVCAVIAGIFGILAPVLAAAKVAAKATVDINQLHQIGLQAEMYAVDHDSLRTYYPEELVTSANLPAKLLVSQLDDSPRGFGNEIRAEFSNPYGHRISPLRVSYISSGDAVSQDVAQSFETLPANGWLAALNGARFEKQSGIIFEGRFTRLRYDTSAKTFPLVPIDCTRPPYDSMTEWNVNWFFIDEVHKC